MILHKCSFAQENFVFVTCFAKSFAIEGIIAYYISFTYILPEIKFDLLLV